MKVVFITDGGLKMGMGHVYRSLTLAEEIRNIAEINFLTKSGDIVVSKINSYGYTVSKLKNNKEVILKIKEIKPDVVVIDKLNVESNFTRVLKEKLNIKKLILFDNLSQANIYADVVVNAIIGSNFENRKYINKITNTLYFCGPRYLILRKIFYKYKSKKKKKNNKKIEKILLIFGGSDPSNLTSKVLEDILSNIKNKNNLKINIVLGPHFTYYNKLNKILEKYKHSNIYIKIYKDVENVAELMYNSDLVVTSPGLSMFEALFIRVPVIAIYQNKLQRNIYQKFFDNIEEVNNQNIAFLKYGFFINSEDKYIKELYIGEGKFEILEALTNIDPYKNMGNDNTRILLQQVTDDDLELLMAWRSNPLVYKYFYSQKEPLKWNEHYNWWISRQNRVDWIIVLHDGKRPRKVGSVNATLLDTDNPEIGIYIGEVTLWGKGIGKHSVSLVIEWLKKMGYKNIRARIMKDNQRSIKLFESLGFKKIGKGRENEWIYELKID